MMQSVGTLMALLGTVIASLEVILPLPGGSSNNALFLEPGNLAPSGLYTIQHGQTVLDQDIPFPIRTLSLNDIKPLNNPHRQEMVCCPPGTVFDSRTQSCVFLASSLCPPGFDLDAATKSICISKTPPCPGDLFLDNGRCVSPHGPQCVDKNANYDNATHMCIGTVNPVCDSPLVRLGADCISKEPPVCDMGFKQIGTQCVLITGPTCGPAEQGLLPHPTPDGRMVCVSTAKPSCPEGSKPVGDNCQILRDPCPKDFVNKDGSCVYTGTPCPEGGVFTTFDDERIPVCRITEDPVCLLGELQGSMCVSKESPCPDGYDFKPDGQCKGSFPVDCGPGSKLFTTPFSNPADQPRGLCCPDIPNMTLDSRDRCSIPAATNPCPEGMSRDPNSAAQCILIPTQANCPKGTLDPTTGNCIDTVPSVCTSGGTPDPTTGKCNLGEPTCKAKGLNYKYDKATNRCYLDQTPKCPAGSRQLGATGDCISDDPITCPHADAGAVLSPDFKSCIFQAPPDCRGKGTYDPKLHLCVAPNKPVCPAEAVDGAHIDGTDCVSPSRPACPPGSDTTFDPNTSKCVGKKPPQCGSGFHLDRGEADGKCVSDDPPKCRGDGFVLHEGKCISDVKPLCPVGSKWEGMLKACVSDKPPCPENSPTVDGKCVISKPPECPPGSGTHFEKDVPFCVSDTVKPTCEGSVAGVETKLEGGQCVALQGPRCENDDLEPVGDQCVSKTQKPRCPSDTEAERDAEGNATGRCIAKTPPVCGDNGEVPRLNFDQASGLCLGGPPACPDKTQLDVGLAKCVTASLRTCFALLSCPPVVDDSVLGIGEP